MTGLGPGCVKRARAKIAQNCFLYCLLPIAIPALFVLRLTKIKMDILIRKLTCRVFTQPRAIVLKIPFRRCSICWKTYGRGIQKIGWGTSQSGDGTACEVLNRSEMLLSGDVPSD